MNAKEWTIMIYLAGDNNLSVDMAYAMEQIKSVAGEESNGTNLFVYYDGNSESIPTLYCDFSDSANPKYVRSFKVPNKLYRVEPKRNENGADYRSVLNFVDWCLNKVEVETGDTVRRGRRADRYGLIFSGHSLGFEDPGLFRDETAGKSMSMDNLFLLVDRLTRSREQLAKNVHEMDLEYEKEHRFDEDPDADRRRGTELVGQRFDILGFDSCVMGMLEVGYQFKDSTKTMIASEGSVPSAGWTYAKILGTLARDYSPLDDNEVAERFVVNFIKSQNSFTVGGVSVDMAAWDMSKINGLNAEFETLSDVLIDCFDDPAASIYRHMERAILQVHWKCQSYMFDQNVDLGDFCELLQAECASLAMDLGRNEEPLLQKVQQACERVLEELRITVILSGFSGGGYQYSNGISIFFPWSYVAYQVSEKYYKRLKFVANGAGQSWRRFLKRYLGEVTLRPFEDPASIVPERSLAAAGGADVTAYSMPATKQRYSSFKYNEDDRSLGITGQQESESAAPQNSKIAGQQNSKIAGQQNSKIAGQQNSKIAGQQNSKIAGQQNSKIAGQQNSKIAGQQNSKIAGQQNSKIAGQQNSKIAGQQNSKIAGQQNSKLAGQQNSKLAGQQNSKLAGQQNSKLAGQQNSKLAGQQNSKLAGQQNSKLGGGGGSNAFFNSLQGFKNIESRWNISGFTKKPAEDDSKG